MKFSDESGLNWTRSPERRRVRSTVSASWLAFLSILTSLAGTACHGDSEAHLLPTISVDPPPVSPASTTTQAGARTRSDASSGHSDSTASVLNTSGTSSRTSSGTAPGATAPGVTSSASTSTDGPQSSSTASTSGNSSTSSGSGGAAQPDKETCLKLCEKGSQDAFADCVVEFKPNPITARYTEEFQSKDPKTGETVTKTREFLGWNHDKMPDVVLGPPRGSKDTVSLGCEGVLTVGFVDPPITDGPGPDLIVFENPFSPTFPEPARIEVSDDACTWHAFPCDPITLKGCAGVAMVDALPGTDIDPTDPTVAGGDAFDLAQLKLSRARFVRVTSVSREYWLAKENTEQWCDPSPLTTGKGGTDIDAFAVVHHE